jgi:hypothetical protein
MEVRVGSGGRLEAQPRPITPEWASASEKVARHYVIPFTKREEFESAWPHILKVKSKGAPIFLVSAPKTDPIEIKPAGVLIQIGGAGALVEVLIGAERPRFDAGDVRAKWSNATYIELAVDGDVVDLNRIRFPKDTPIIDERRVGDGKK